MIEINYVHSLADQPDIYLKNHTDDGIGMYGDPIGPVRAEFLGYVDYEGQKYLIGRTTEAFNNDPNYIGKITVRHAMVNKTEQGLDKDMFIDMEEDDNTRKLEHDLREEDQKVKLTNVSMLHRTGEPKLEVLPYGSMLQADTVTAIGIRHVPYVYVEMCRKEEELERLEYEYMKVNNTINEYSRILRKDKNESFF